MIGSIIFLMVLIFLNAVFASAEIAVISMSETRLKRLTEDGDRRAVKLSALTQQPAKFLATIQVAITLAGQLGSAFAADSFSDPLVEKMIDAGVRVPANVLNMASVIVITLILAYFNLVFGELVPKRIAMKKSEAMALGMSGMLHTISKIFAPLVFLLTVSTNLILRMMGFNPEEEDEQVTEEEIRMLLTEGNAQGNIDEEENEMIQNIFEFDDISVEQICTHRVDMTALYLEDDMEEWAETIDKNRHTYYPVCGEDRDDVVGILDIKDYFRLEDKSRESVIEHALHKPYFIPENMKANVLFQKMRLLRTYFAVIVDEYGGVSGIITLHDLVEALVGDLYDMEEEAQPDDIEELRENQWRIQGWADIEDVAEELKVNLPVEDYDTFGGFILNVIDRIPDDGEQFECEACELKIYVKSVENHRIGETVVRKLKTIE